MQRLCSSLDPVFPDMMVTTILITYFGWFTDAASASTVVLTSGWIIVQNA